MSSDKQLPELGEPRVHGQEYKVVSKANPQNREDVKFYPQIVHKGIISRARLEAAIVRETSLSRSDVRALLVIFSDLVSDYLTQGFKVRLEELGLLSLRTKTKGEVNQEDVNAKSIEHVSVGFRGAGELMEKLAKTKFDKAKDNGAS